MNTNLSTVLKKLLIQYVFVVKILKLHLITFSIVQTRWPSWIQPVLLFPIIFAFAWNAFAIACVLLLLVLIQRYPECLEIRSKKLLQITEQQYTLLEIQFSSLKYTAVNRMDKVLSNFPLLSKRNKARSVCWCIVTTYPKQFSNTSDCI